MSRVVIDPVTRVNGGLRVEVEVAGGAVSDAWVSGTMFRGLETVLRGREPLGAWLLAQRICGDCSGVHALASVRAVENALGVAIPRNARTIRNIVLGSEFVLDHVGQFYQGQVLDWLRPLSALAADPSATSALARTMSPRLRSDAAYFRDARDRLSTFVASGGSGPFLDDGSGGPAPLTSPEATLMIMAHYLEALDWRRRIVQLQTLLGGKSPHPQTFLVGGMALAAPWGGPPPAPPGEHPTQIDQRAPAALSADGLTLIARIVAEAKAFVDEVYVPDTIEIARADPGAAQVGSGLGNYLAFGEFPLEDSAKSGLLLPRGRVIGRDLASVQPVDQAEIGETVATAHYTYDGDDGAFRHPLQGLTVARYGGPTLPFTSLAGADRYSWVKAPRYRGEAMEVGPLARVLVAYVEGQQAVRDGIQQVVGELGLGPDILFSTLGRTLARAIEAGVLVDRLGVWVDELKATLGAGDLAVADLGHWSPETWPSTADGVSLGEGPRGAVGHWLTIADHRLAAYQVVDASTWNASPRDAAGRPGAIEEALVGVPVPDLERPSEVLRTVRSFGPCLTCAVH